MTAWTAALVTLSTAPGILLTGAAVHLYRRRRIPAAGLLVTATVAALAATAGAVSLTDAPRWVPLAIVLATIPIGHGYALAMARRHLRHRPGR